MDARTSVRISPTSCRAVGDIRSQHPRVGHGLNTPGHKSILEGRGHPSSAAVMYQQILGDQWRQSLETGSPWPNIQTDLVKK